MSDTANRCREEFEYWCVKQGLHSGRRKDDSRYERQETRGAWAAWRFFWAGRSDPPVDDSEWAWVIKFYDTEVSDEVFMGCGAKDAALKRFEQISMNWNAHLFREYPQGAPAIDVGTNYLDIRMELAKLSGIPAMAITANDHVRTISELLKRESGKLECLDEPKTRGAIQEALTKYFSAADKAYGKHIGACADVIEAIRNSIEGRSS